METNKNGNSSSSTHVVPEAGSALDKMKYEIANEFGVTLKQGYNGDIAARDAGKIGGQMTKRLVEQAERSLSGK